MGGAWDFITPRSLIDLQRVQAVEAEGAKAAELYAEGYALEADRVLDALNDRRERWRCG